MGKTYVPRWLHARKTVGAGAIELIDSALFANTDLWPMQLHWLSVTGDCRDSLETGQAPAHQYEIYAGGVARRLFFEIGISQKSDSAINYAYTCALMAHNERLLQHFGPYDYGLRFGFPSLIDLPPDTGLSVEMATYFAEEVSGTTYYLWNPGLLLNGIVKTDGGEIKPAQLGGFAPSNETTPITNGTKVGIHNADLFNDGKETISLKEMMLTASQFFQAQRSKDYHTVPQLDRTAWRINPTSGPQWMPKPDPIPAGNICPFNLSMQYFDEGPKAYVFPDGVYLNPRQRVGVKVGNLSATEKQTFNICLFGLMEVE